MLALALTLSVASGGLLSESPSSYSVRLVSSAAPLMDVETMSRTELEMERARLIDNRPGLGGGIALLAIGGGATVLFGLPIILFSVIDYFIVEAFVVGLIITVVGLGAVAAGIVLVASALATRSASAARVGQIDDRIRRMEQNVTPPPPPPPPSGWVLPAEPALLLANF